MTRCETGDYARCGSVGSKLDALPPPRHAVAMEENAERPDDENGFRPGEVAVELPAKTDAGIYFIGAIRTPWRSRRDCPKRGSPDGPLCSIVVDERWRAALSGLAGQRRIQVLYWMHCARRDLVLQTPSGTPTTGTFALRSPVRPNPIAVSIVELVEITGTTLRVRGLDCLDGTPLLDVKPDWPTTHAG
jgi:tRNA (adenine37-N6)-methyltransferase